MTTDSNRVHGCQVDSWRVCTRAMEVVQKKFKYEQKKENGGSTVTGVDTPAYMCVLAGGEEVIPSLPIDKHGSRICPNCSCYMHEHEIVTPIGIHCFPCFPTVICAWRAISCKC